MWKFVFGPLKTAWQYAYECKSCQGVFDNPSTIATSPCVDCGSNRGYEKVTVRYTKGAVWTDWVMEIK